MPKVPGKSPFAKGSRLQLKAVHLAEDGRGVAPHQSVNVQVADLLPGESAEVEVEHVSPHRGLAWAHVLRRLGPLSKDRAEPACPAYGACGGCQWQHMSYGAQLEEKRDRLRQSLINVPEARSLPVPHAAPAVFQYRNKGKYVFGKQQGRILLGAYKPRSHSVISTIGCQVVMPCIDAAARVLWELASERRLAIYSEAKREPGYRYAIVRANRKQEMLVILVASSAVDAHEQAALATELVARDPRVVGVLGCRNDRESGALLTEDFVPLWGRQTLEENVLEVPLQLGPSAFFQVNHAQAESAYGDIAQALADATPGPMKGTVLELYAGVGGIGLALAALGHRVLGIEISSEAVATANQAAQDANLAERARFVCGDAASEGRRFLDTLKGPCSAVVVDPPRKGLGRAGVALLCDLAAPVVAYLSCGPESLARDLVVLTEAGYEVEELKAYDFMPGTAQVETLAILRRQPQAAEG